MCTIQGCNRFPVMRYAIVKFCGTAPLAGMVLCRATVLGVNTLLGSTNQKVEITLRTGSANLLIGILKYQPHSW